MDETCISSENITSAKKKQIQKIDTFLNDYHGAAIPPQCGTVSLPIPLMV